MTTQEAVRAIKEIIASGRTVERETLYPYAETHAQACTRIMEKAFHADRLLKENKRAEALSLVQKNPDLKAEYELVDFETVNDWWTLCENYDLPRCHLVIPEMITRTINALYSARPEYAALLRRHRLLALSRGSLGERLHVLRKLAELDASSAFWKKDIALFEKAWLEHLSVEAVRADREGDLPALERIAGELQDATWQDPQAANLLTRVRDLIVPHRKQAVNRRYRDLAALMLQAHEHMDDLEMTGLYQGWQDLQDQYGIGPDAELERQTEAARAWICEVIEQQQKELDYLQACETLDQFVSEPGGDLAELDELAARVLSFEMDFPELLALRYNTKRKELEKKAHARFITRLVAVVVTLALLAGGAAWLIDAQMLRQNINKWQTNLTAALTQDNFEATAALFDELKKHPRILTDPEIQSLQGEFALMEQNEQARRSELAECMARLEAGDYSAQLFVQVDKLTRTAREKALIEPHRQAYLKSEDAEQRRLNETYKQQLADLETLYSTLTSLPLDNIDTITQEVEKCKFHATQLMNSPRVFAHIAARARGISQSSEDFLRRAHTERDINKIIDEMISSISRPERIAAMVQQFIENYPRDRHTIGFKAQLPSYDSVAAMAQWRAIRARMSGDGLVTHARQIDQLYPLIQTYCQTYPNAANAPTAQACLDYFNKIKPAWEADLFIYYDELISIMSVPLMSDCKMAQSGDKTYYVSGQLTVDAIFEKKELGEKNCKLDYFYNGSGNTRSVSLSWTDVRNTLADAPQNDLYRKINAHIEQGRLTSQPNCSQTLLACLHDTIQSKCDPILSISLARLLADYLEKSQPWTNDAIVRMRNRIDEIDLDVAWMDPDSVEATAIRPRAQRILEALQNDFQAAGREQDARRADWRFQLASYEPIGIVIDGRLCGAGDWAPEPPVTVYQLALDNGGRFAPQSLPMVDAGNPPGMNLTHVMDGAILFIRNDTISSQESQ